MATVSISYAANSNFTLTLASLGNGSSRQSTEITNSSNYLDALVMLKVKTGASTSGDKAVYVYAGGSVDDGTTRTDGAGASDAAITLPSPENVRLIGVVNTPSSATTYYGGPFSVAAAFGGILPERWFIVVKNATGASLDSTEGNHGYIYQPVQATVA